MIIIRLHHLSCGRKVLHVYTKYKYIHYLSITLHFLWQNTKLFKDSIS